MAENNGGAAGAAGSDEGGAKTFTQEEVNAMIGKRVNEVTSKYADYEDLKTKASKYDEQQNKGKTELQKANERADSLQAQLDKLIKENTVRQARAKVSEEMKVPVELLTEESEEACKKQAEAILAFAKPQGYPGAKQNKGNTQGMTQLDADLAAWSNQIFGGR